MPRDIDCLTSPTLKHLRDRWWDDSFTAFLIDTLHPRAGDRILDVGSGGGTAARHLGEGAAPPVHLVGVDVLVDRVRDALAAAREQGLRAVYAGADVCALPFPDAMFDATFTVAVLQHLADGDLPMALDELARVTRPGGRVLLVEPDNAARYWYSSLDEGRQAFDRSASALAALGRDRFPTDPSLGPKLPTLVARFGIQPLTVRLFPVSVSRVGAPSREVWEGRKTILRSLLERSPDANARLEGAEYLALVERYATAAQQAGPAFVEIQNTMLFATIGQRIGPRRA